MSDLTRKDAGIPIIGRKDESPFAPKNDGWLRDVTAANFGINIRTPADLAALLGEEKLFCDLCGREFPLWPIRQWAAHYVHDHHDEVTLQMIGGVSQLLTDELTDESTPSVQQWFGTVLLSRVSVRQRAHDLGLIKWLPPNASARADG